MIKLYFPRDAIELALIESILGGENIPYFIHNDHFDLRNLRGQSPISQPDAIQQVPEVLQKLKGTQFRLVTESGSDDIAVEIVYELYDDSIEFSGPASMEQEVMSILDGN